MSRRRREKVGGEPDGRVGDDEDRVPETEVEALTRDIEGLSSTGAVVGAAGSGGGSQDAITEGKSAGVGDHEQMLAWYVKSQIQASPLTPAEIAERSGVSVSQIYRFLKGERSLTLESADRLLPVVGRSLVERLRGYQALKRSTEASMESVGEEIEDEKEKLRQRLERWERKASEEVEHVMKDMASLADRLRSMIDDL